jgi:hypothetical protein
MKKLITMKFNRASLGVKVPLLIIAGILATGSAFALEDKIEIFGEVKTGFLFEQRDEAGKTTSFARINNNDGDAGASEGRIRMGMAISILNFGLRTQFYQDNFERRTGAGDKNMFKVRTDFAYVYGTTFNSQLKISAGLLGESPWGSFFPDRNPVLPPNLYKELESSGGGPIMGIRFEWKPTFTPAIRGLNIGFVLNRSDEGVPLDAKQEFGDLFRESIVGIAWDHKYFGLRFAYRFDRDVKSDAVFVTGEKFVYRVEERLLWNYLPGFQISANGYCEGINSEGRGSGYGPPGYIQHWLYIHYDPMYFITGIDTGYQDNFVKQTGQALEIKPFFYYKFINNYLVAGLMAGMVMGFNGTESYKDVFYNEWYVEPKIQFNIHNNFYIALVYRYTSMAFETLGNNDYYKQFFNLRLSYKY